jgi:hypothetical protein
MAARYASGAVHRPLLAVLAICAGGCATAYSGDTADAHRAADAADSDTAHHDAAVTTPHDAPGSGSGSGSNPMFEDAAVQANQTLLLSEILLDGKEFVEIVNPTTAAVTLTNYYLSDSGDYYKLPAFGASITVDTGDFIVRFPSGSSIAGHAAVTVSIDTAASFDAQYGVEPTYSIADGTITTVVASQPSLTNTGEMVVLFEWDGAQDLVRDVDLMIAGQPTIGNLPINKSGVAQDGPDTGSQTTAYATDAMSIAAQSATPGSNKSTKRVALESGHETQNGTGNGLSGDDETSEATGTTWDSTFTAATPGVVPSALLQ